ncbi:DoxX family protein [Actinocrispum wychmicini]|uniref:Putative membrane protein n=1 Tax=Actinocrispum wychmicini TaxID=1213861 RepID=A0A4R2JNG1_9PSEU|nr:hypothetical protein [Actinocrispum wychmicini]TCO58676.1 putative membrane protein [Actinocrispum wychmicini]
MSESRRALALSLLLGTSGTLHFLMPKPYDRLIPRELPGKARTWTYASGLGELGTALLITIPRTRRFGALLAALLFVAVFPGNVKMALDYHRKRRPLPHRVVAFLRLPLQWPLVAWALRVRDNAR